VTRRPRYTQKDLNQPSIVADLEKLGAVVWDVADLVNTLDLVVHWRGKTRPVEIKRPGHRDDLTPNERETIAALRAVGVEPIIATCAEDVVGDWCPLDKQEARRYN